MFKKTKVYPNDELVCNQYMMFKIYIYYHGENLYCLKMRDPNFLKH